MFVVLLMFEGARLALRAMLVVLSLHFLRSAWRGVRGHDPPRPDPPQSWPKVVVQIPLRNEFYVAERVIRCAAALRYPQAQLLVQVLDDSDDETTSAVQKLIAELGRAPVNIELVHRDHAHGFKAGALNEGLARTDAALVAMFDADCAPEPDFLERTVPYFADASVGCVQVRWSFLNRAHSVLTRIQAIVLDGLTAVDQFARGVSHLPMQFNGTNGVWRADAIRDTGGWRGDILAEDADLSFRAHLKGWKLVHLRDYAVPTELPVDMAAFRVQQMRWARGSAQLITALAWPILKSDLPMRAKLMMILHMGRHGIDPLIMMATLTSPFTTLYGFGFLIDYRVPINSALFGLLGIACVAFYGTGLRVVRARWREFVLIPLVIPLAIGMSFAYSIAFTRGLVARGGTFVRTPKAGTQPHSGPRYRSQRPLALWAEVALGGAHAYFTLVAMQVGLYAEACFFAMLSLSFLWVGIGTLLSRGVGTRP